MEGLKSFQIPQIRTQGPNSLKVGDLSGKVPQLPQFKDIRFTNPIKGIEINNNNSQNLE